MLAEVRPEVAEPFMREALRLAARGLGRTAPNPAVGAVVVKGGAIVGRGYHAVAAAHTSWWGGRPTPR
jgi:diaminohydroxyphosphoribosylaminopyrimidine deaminase/5-amino-6-(5-phosphoribosylamino)uracil reductase